MQVEGLHIRVDRAGQSAHGSAGGSVMYERNRTVFVGNLPFDVEVRTHRYALVTVALFCTAILRKSPVWAVREGWGKMGGGDRGMQGHCSAPSFQNFLHGREALPVLHAFVQQNVNTSGPVCAIIHALYFILYNIHCQLHMRRRAQKA